jgi:hypothetical protein
MYVKKSNVKFSNILSTAYNGVIITAKIIFYVNMDIVPSKELWFLIKNCVEPFSSNT